MLSKNPEKSGRWGYAGLFSGNIRLSGSHLLERFLCVAGPAVEMDGSVLQTVLLSVVGYVVEAVAKGADTSASPGEVPAVGDGQDKPTLAVVHALSRSAPSHSGCSAPSWSGGEYHEHPVLM